MARGKRNSPELEDDPLWYKDAVIYEVHVRAFFDSNGDGIGDFRGLTRKLDYIKDLGVTVIWLLPFYPSPLKDDGYDIADYYGIHPVYGTLQDFRSFLAAAHLRGLRVITELVLNHTSDQHPWFQKSRQAKPGRKWRDHYVWSDTAERYRDARIIFKDFESSNWAWDPQAGRYYWHRFYSHQPDLNFDSPDVRATMLDIVDFWFGMGVDGLRLDAVPYLYEREGTSCENLAETHAFLKELRAYVDERFRNRLLIAEANQWPEDAVAYFGDGDEAHMAFHFPLMPRIFMALRMENSFPIIDILNSTPQIPDTCQWGLFLRNHDELTLEMVTDEERDYMYRVYARDPHQRINLGIRRRLAPLMRNDRREMELIKAILFSLPGTVIIYYGDEIGMGDNFYLGDRNSVRTPMQWSADKNAGFSQANPQRLYLPIIIDPEYHYEAVNVEVQQLNTSSFLWWIKRLIRVARRFRAFSRGTIQFVPTNNTKVLAYLRQYQDEHILAVFNLSKTSQFVSMDLPAYAGAVPREMFSQNLFPKVTEGPYILTLGPHDYFWLLLPGGETGADAAESLRLPSRALPEACQDLSECPKRWQIEEILADYLNQGPGAWPISSSIRRSDVLELIPVTWDPAGTMYVAIVENAYTDGLTEFLFLPFMFSTGRDAERIVAETPEVVIMRLALGEKKGILHEGIYDARFRDMLLRFATGRRRVPGTHGMLVSHGGRRPNGSSGAPGAATSQSQHFVVGHQFTLIVFADNRVLKVYPRIDPEPNPEREILQFLNQNTSFSNCPVLTGSVEYIPTGSGPVTLGLLEENAFSQTTARMFAEHALDAFYQRVLLERATPRKLSLFGTDSIETGTDGPELIELFFLDMMRLLGTRTAELHRALASARDNADFTPEPFTRLYQRSVFQSFRGLTRRTLRSLEMNVRPVDPAHHAGLQAVLALEPTIVALLERLTQKKIPTVKTRIHGDYHLGQVLYTGKDFVIANFEGDPTRLPGERRLKYSPLRDVAGMIWSLHYSAWSRLLGNSTLGPDEIAQLEPWATYWARNVSRAFMAGYLEAAGQARFIPEQADDVQLLIETYLLERSLTKIGYLLRHRPKQVDAAFRVLESIVEEVADGDVPGPGGAG